MVTVHAPSETVWQRMEVEHSVSFAALIGAKAEALVAHLAQESRHQARLAQRQVGTVAAEAKTVSKNRGTS